MFWAINSVTKNRISALSAEFDEQFFKDEKWFADPLYIDEVPEEIKKDEIEVRFRKGCDEIINSSGTIYQRFPHFFIPSKDKLGIVSREESEDHKKCCSIVYNLLLNNAKLRISSTKYGDNLKNIDKESIDLNKIDFEVNVISRGIKRGDIVLPLNKFDPLIGYGIIFEIQLSEQEYPTELQRSYIRARDGYSLCWLSKIGLKELMDSNEKIIDIESYLDILDNHSKFQYDKIKTLTINYVRMIEEKIRPIEDMARELDYPKTTTCPNCNNIMILKKGKFGDFYGCSNYPSCKKTITLN